MGQKPVYDHRKIETKWQTRWVEEKTFRCEVDKSKPKYYVLDMFPYPSGAGLHVGHAEGYTATDILARYKRMKGFNVLHPMGWDSFGLPAEQYAVRTGTHPAKTTKNNIDNFRRQLQALGFSYDWDREIATSDPDYYKWTQWIFTKLYEKGLAYEAEVNVNFCPALGTVLSNEEVENGCAKEGGYPVERRPLKQWILKITKYADRLLKDLDLLDWPDGLKRLQRNWIGRSTGANVSFDIPAINEQLSIYTTRPDTLFGASYMAVAPEHPLLAQLTTPEHKEAVTAYQKAAAAKSDMARTELSKDKSGVFTGAYAINPVNQKQIPIWVADYVLMTYGTGAVMAVPAHDERDFEFAQKFDLEILPVFDPDIQGQPEMLPEGVPAKQAREQILAGQLCWPGDGVCINSSSDTFSINGMGIKEATKTITQWLEDHGKGEQAVSYKLRDWLFSRQRYWGEPFPILHLEDGSQRILSVDELPLCPPEINNYQPSGDGKSPLARKTEWVEIHDPVSGQKARRETNTMPQWAGSCWYYLRFCDPTNSEEPFSSEAENYWMPVDLYVGGVEHAVLHLLYARFWHKVLFDCGLVSTPEPFQTLRNQGLIVARSFQKEGGLYVAPEDVKEDNGSFTHRETGEALHMQVEKMSKSKLNGVNPDEIIEEFGADSLRLYEMFMGPLEKEKPWNTDAVNGCRRLLRRLYEIVYGDLVTDTESEAANKLGHRLVHGVTEDIEKLQFNTAIAKMMEFMNDFSKLEAYPRNVLKMAVSVLSPFAPHLASECWEALGEEGELGLASWYSADERYLQEECVTIVVQVNGKVRGRLDMAPEATEETVFQGAREIEGVFRYLEGKEVRKIIYIPGRLMNIVVS